MLMPVWLSLRRWNPISADLSLRHSVEPLVAIQCAVTAKYNVMFELVQPSTVKLIQLQDCF
jgi:hypothetical protein